MGRVESDPSSEQNSPPPDASPGKPRGPAANGPPAEDVATRSTLERLISFFFRTEDPHKQKRRQVREIGKQLKRMKQKLYDPGRELAQPALGRLMFVYYKLFGPAQNLVKRAESSQALKEIVIELGMTETQRRLRGGLEEPAIRGRLKTAGPNELAAQLREELKVLFSEYSAEKLRAVDTLYNQLAAFLDLVHFDYYFVLKKFDSRMRENDFAYEPKLDAINGEYLLDDLKEFDDILLGIDGKTDWTKVFAILREYRNVEVVPEKSWPKVWRKLLDLRKSRVFELIIKHLSKDPAYSPNPAVHNEKIAEQYLAKLKTGTELIIQKILRERRQERIEELAEELFASAKVHRTKNYTEKANPIFRKLMFSGYTHISAVNYTKAFLDDYFQAEIHDLLNLLLIKGKWASPQASQPLSDRLHRLFKLSDNIEDLDKSLADEEDTGRRLKNLCYGAAKDKKLLPRVRKMLGSINETYQAVVYETAQNLIAIGKILKQVLEDGGKQQPDLILNWREINGSVDGSLRKLIVDVYKKIHCFVQLIQFFIDKEKAAAASAASRGAAVSTAPPAAAGAAASAVEEP